MSYTNRGRLFALLDCNNFFVSCERLFDPKLKDKPVVVLSNNDGCIIARSNEAKALGIPMGAPLFKWADFLKKKGVVIRSSNFALYGDLSHRVMEMVTSENSDTEMYSVDEAFVRLDTQDPLLFCRALRDKILKWTGIPVSIGIAKTKTLAKVANQRAKRDPALKGVYALFSRAEEAEALRHFPIEDVWGIGRRFAPFLHSRGIKTALAFKNLEDSWLKKHLSVVGLRIAWELCGVSCLPLEEMASIKKSIMTSRSFSQSVTKKEELAQAIATHAMRGGKKLREEGVLASALTVFIRTSPHKTGEPFYSNSANHVFEMPTNYPPKLINAAKEMLNTIFLPDRSYKKAGVLLSGLVPHTPLQQDLFFKPNTSFENKVNTLIDTINKRFGKKAVTFAAEGTKKAWEYQRQLTSPAFTTEWDELLTIRI